MAELNANADPNAKKRFAGVREISKDIYVAEVNKAPKGVWVVQLLYQDYIDVCRTLCTIMDEMAEKYGDIKFLKSIATRCIEKYPDHNCPTLIIYKDGSLQHNKVRFELGYRKMTLASFEDLLSKMGLIELPGQTDEEAKHFKGLTQTAGQGKRKGSVDSDEDEREDKGFANNKLSFKYV